jgi:hypothetical protein
MEKQLFEISLENSENLVADFKNEIKKLGLKSLDLIQTKLNYLCHNYDPYDNLDIPNEVENIINEYGLKEYTQNPFMFTNYLLQLLDNLEQEIKSRKN